MAEVHWDKKQGSAPMKGLMHNGDQLNPFQEGDFNHAKMQHPLFQTIFNSLQNQIKRRERRHTHWQTFEKNTCCMIHLSFWNTPPNKKTNTHHEKLLSNDFCLDAESPMSSFNFNSATFKTLTTFHFTWLVVSTHLKNISQNGNLPQIGVKTKNI